MNFRVATVVDFTRAEELAGRLAAAVSSRRLYGADHALTNHARRAFVAALLDFLEDDAAPETFRLVSDGGALTVEGIPLSRASLFGKLLCRLESVGLSGIGFTGRVSDKSIAALVDWLAERDGLPPKSGFPGVELIAESVGAGGRVARDPADLLVDRVPEMRLPLRIYRTAAQALEAAMKDLRAGRDLNLHELSEISEWVAEEAFRSGLQLIGPTRFVRQDEDTLQHSVHVFLITTALLQPFAKSARELAEIAQAALLHDIGKSRVPAEIVGKRGKLTEAELELMRRHPEYGAEILRGYDAMSPLAIEVAYCHHMRDGGHGYPRPVLPIKPGPVTHVVQVADMFEALTAKRSYKESSTVDEAVRILVATAGMESRKPALWLLLGRLTGSPPGSEVVLSSGERAVVVRAHEDAPKKPLVRVLSDAAGAPLEEPRLVDLRSATPQRVVEKVYLRPSSVQTVEA